MKKILVSFSALALAGCASGADQIAATPTSSAMYMGLSCAQMQNEAVRIGSKVRDLSGQQDRKRSNDQAATAVTLVLFWPAAFFIGGDDETAASLANVKGQRDALLSAASAKGCPIRG